MKKISSAGIKNSQLKKIQRQEGSLKSSSKKLKIYNGCELPSITMSMSPNVDKIRKKSIRLRQNLNASNSQNSKQFKQNGLSSIKTKLLFITKRPQNAISKSQTNDSLYMNAEIKASQRVNIKNPSFQPHQNKIIYYDTIQYGPARSKGKIQKKKRSESVKQNKEVSQQNIKMLFNHIQNRLKTKKNKNELKHNQSCYTHNFPQLITFSQILTTPGATKSLLSSPRFQLLQIKKKQNHLTGAYIVNLAQQMDRLQSFEIKNQDSLKMLINQQIGLLNLELYRSRKKQKAKE